MKKFLFYISQNYSFAILRPLQKLLLARGDQVYWFVEGDKVNLSFFQGDEKRIDSATKIFEYDADVVLAPANSIPSFLPGLKVSVFHGFDAGKLDSRGRNDHFKIRDCFDLYCTQGPSTTAGFRQLQQSRGYFNVIETGWPALDPLFDKDAAPAANSRPVIFLGSTFTSGLTQANYLFPKVRELSQTMDWQWIVSLHPKSDEKVLDRYRSIAGENLSYIDTDDMIPILREADIMVGDTSSALTMFIVQNKPVVTVNNIDPKDYFINITDAAELKPAIEKALLRPPELMQRINAYNAETHPYRDGKSSQRVIVAIDEVLAGMHPLKRNKPLNLLRNLKFRKRLGYWKF